ncbi:MAG: amidase [Actinobacteria bacterium]|nr:amidase [Actinomycetota bacterium]
MDSAELAFAGIARLAELVRAREVSPRELVDVYLDRIERLDPRLNTFRVVFAERARAEAQQAEGRAGAGDDRPLLGVPVAVKDNVDIAGEVTAQGSAAAGEPAPRDAEQVRLLRESGAIILGKTQMPELAIWPWTESQAFGVTRNPWDTRLSPGGSSGGSAAAVAAGLAAAASATDGGGSIRLPAAACGLVGLKTQRGRVAFEPLDHWHGLSVAGSVTRRVVDTALWLDVVAAERPARPFTDSAGAVPERLRISTSVKPGALGVRVHESVRLAVEETAGVLRSLGHEVRPRDPAYGDIRPPFVPRWLRGIHDDARAMPHPDRLERRTRALERMGALVGQRGARRARRTESRTAARFNAVFDECDVLVTATTHAPPPEADRLHGAGWFSSLNGATPIASFTTPWNVTGQPACSIPPPTWDAGAPVGVQLVGRPGDEATLLSLAAQLEAEIGWPDRRPPLD